MPRVLFNTTHYNHQIISKVVPTTVTPTNTSFLSSSTLNPNNSLFPVVNNIGGIALFALVLAAFFCFCICVICLGGLCADLSSAATKHRCFCCCFCCECCLEEQIEEEENNNESDFSYRRWQRRRLRRQNQSNLIYNAATAVHMPSMLLLQLMLADSINNYNKNNKNIGGLQMMNNSKKGFEGEGRLSI